MQVAVPNTINMIQILEFLKSETGKRMVNWSLSTGLSIIVLGSWVYTLSQKQEATDRKIEEQNLEIRDLYRYQTDTLYRILTRTNHNLERLNDDKRTTARSSQ